MRFSLYRNGPRAWIPYYNDTDRMKPWESPPIVKNKFARNILITLALGAGGALVTMSPAGAVYFMVHGAIILALKGSDYRREIKRLEKKGYLALKKNPKGIAVKLLQKAQRRLDAISLDEMKLARPRKWDGKWRFYIFDIPEKERSARNLVRQKLKDLGLYNIQRSVFVYPYDCRKELDLLGDYYKIGEYATYAEVAYSDIDRELRRFFRRDKLI